MNICKQCGAKSEWKFCSTCGIPMVPYVEEQPVATEPVATEQVVAEPVAVEPVVAQPADAQPVMAPVEPQPMMAPVEPQQPMANQPVEGKKKSKKKVVIISLVAGLVVVAAVVVLLVILLSGSPVDSIKEALDEDNYVLANQEFLKNAKNFEQEDIVELTKYLDEELEEAKEKFLKEELSREEFQNVCSAMALYNIPQINDKASEYDFFATSIEVSRDYYENGEANFEGGYYKDAVYYYLNVDEIDPNYEDAQSKIQQCYENYKADAIKKAKEYADNDDYSRACDVIGEAMEFISDDEELKELYEEYEVGMSNSFYDEVISSAKDYADDGEYTDAINKITGEMYNSDITEEILENLQDALDDICKDAFKDAKKCAENEEYEEAFAILVVLASTSKWDDCSEADEYALQILPAYKSVVALQAQTMFDEGMTDEIKDFVTSCVNNYFTQEMADEIISLYVPAGLKDIEPIADSGYIYVGPEYLLNTAGMVSPTLYTDAYGSTYEWGMNKRIANFEAELSYVEYNVSNYNTLSALVILNETCKESEKAGRVVIYGDDQVIYTSGDVMKGFASEPITVDLENVSVMRIEFEGEYQNVSLITPILSR
ncbi:MAG: NPCBM/NEW2 domain-containing protein [Lachnospiraceae bacterium]|nr:NPCBM/NEW2 domain-containing protein [Lachnospiraceae bacterium]